QGSSRTRTTGPRPAIAAWRESLHAHLPDLEPPDEIGTRIQLQALREHRRLLAQASLIGPALRARFPRPIRSPANFGGGLVLAARRDGEQQEERDGEKAKLESHEAYTTAKLGRILP